MTMEENLTEIIEKTLETLEEYNMAFEAAFQYKDDNFRLNKTKEITDNPFAGALSFPGSLKSMTQVKFRLQYSMRIADGSYYTGEEIFEFSPHARREQIIEKIREFVESLQVRLVMEGIE